MNDKKQTYIAPKMVVLEIEVERGFAASNEDVDEWLDKGSQGW